jgi:DNA polymerase-3 subunit delta'
MSIIGHKKQIEFLRKSLEADKFSQAYLFSGPEGVGKFLIAKNFSKNLVFGGGEFGVDVDNDLRRYANFIFLEPPKKEKKGVVKVGEIKIDEVREAQKKLSTFPSEGRFNVLIVNDAHKMNQGSQNALLKTLEEPNSSSIIILVTHQEGSILQTIKSRSNIVRFGTVALGEIEKDLRERGVSRSNEIALFSMGRPGFAVALERDLEMFDLKKKEYQEFRSIFRSDLSDKLEWAEKQSKDISRAVGALEMWIWFLRVSAYKSVGDQKKIKAIYGIIEKIQKAISKLENSNANGRLVLENLLINF